MNFRKEKENEFFIEHMETFKKLGIPDPFFTIKTAFFQKGRFGRHVQFFQWELEKEQDIYVEFYDNITNSENKVIDLKPMNLDRQLFKYKFNKYFAEEYEKKENTNAQGETYFSYTVPANELIAVLKDGSEITYALYEKRKADKSNTLNEGLPKLQKTLTPNLFPDFEEEFGKKESEKKSEYPLQEMLSNADALISNMTIKDFAAIIWKKPVSDKVWLNSLIEKQ